jgi:hypothetical protein
LRDQRIKMVASDCPNNVEPHLAIPVDEAMAHAGDVTPRDFGMSGLRRV